MTYISEALRRQVISRANGRCEYCLIHQNDRFYAHEIDHIFAEKHGGQTEVENLCLACDECNRHKGSDLCSLDYVSQIVVSLFHPRRDHWRDHFRILDGIVEPLTPTGRVTQKLLQINNPEAVDRRRLLIESGRYASGD